MLLKRIWVGLDPSSAEEKVASQDEHGRVRGPETPPGSQDQAAGPSIGGEGTWEKVYLNAHPPHSQ